MHWPCDPEKDAANRAKHGPSLDLVPLVLADLLAISVPDPHPDGDRWRTIGRVAGRIRFAVLAWPEDEERGTARSISVRKATPSERRKYENG